LTDILARRLKNPQQGYEKEKSKTKLSRILKRQARKAMHKKVIGTTKNRAM